MPSFVQRSNGTLARVTLGYQNGKAIRRSKLFRKGTRQMTIDKWIKQIKSEYEAGLRVSENNDLIINSLAKGHLSPKFDDVMDEFLEFKALSLQPRTLKEYTGECDRYLRGNFGKIGRVNTKDIQKLMKNYHHLSNETQKRIRTLMNMIFNYALNNGYIEDNPVNSNVKISRSKRTRDYEPLSIAQYIEATSKCEDLCLLTLFCTGLRISEAFALTPKQINLDNQTLRIDGASDNHKPAKNRVIGEAKSSYAYATLKLEPELCEKLAVLIAEMDDNDFLFPFGYKYYQTRLDKLCEALSVPRFTLHKIRKNYCVFLLASGVKINLVSKLMRHHSPAFTLDRYSMYIPDMDDSRVSVFGR